MVADNPINNERWSLHGPHADYWRSDNPFIIGWYRFGEDEYPISDTLGQPERTDSASHHHHLATNQAVGTYITHVSGVAPWSASGIQFTGASWLDSATNRALRVDSNYVRDRTDSTTLGYYGIGNAVNSGITIMGWLQVPDTNTNRSTAKKVWANIEGTVSASDGEWQLHLDYSNMSMTWIYNSFGTSSSPGGAVVTVLSNGNPNGYIPVDEPFFFAAQINKGNPLTAQTINTGSGIARLYMGTTTSGLHEVGAVGIIPSTNFWRGDRGMVNNTNFPYTFGADPLSARGNSNAGNLPANSIVDEFVIIADGNMSRERMEHYMNSGIIQDDQDPLGLVETFVPQLPGTDDLVTYWTFDEQGGANTSPNTPSFVNLDMVLNGVTFVDGVHGGSGIRPNSVISRNNAYTFPTNKTGLAHVIGGSGLNHIFPERDQTWIGWIRSEGVSDRGGAIGWFAPTADRHTNIYWNTYIFTSDSIRAAQIDMAITPSGGVPSPRVASIGGISAAGLPNNARQMEDGDWHLVAIVFDFTHGLYRVVYDAHDVYPMLMDGYSVVSGIDKEVMLTSGPDRAGFILGNINATDRCSYDDWAIYDRILTVPEMSGYALSGVDITPVISPIDTAFKRTLGYWKLGEPETYDPESVSGLRFNDESWYRHHLTNVSGNFQQGSFLNDGLGLTTAEVTFSGSTMSVSQTDSSANLDMSASGVWASSGFTAGCWMYVPSGDLETQGNGSSGLDGDHMFMGAWGQEIEEQAWFLGMRNNKFYGAIGSPGIGISTLESSSGIPFNTPFFAAIKVVPSGGKTVIELFRSEDIDNVTDLQLVARDVGAAGRDQLNSASTSGFSLLNAVNRDFGFPSGTRIQGPFVYAGSLLETDLGIVKVAGVEETILGSGAVSIVDAASISHWRFDRRGAQFQDAGQAQNYLTVVNQDSHLVGTIAAIHTSGVVIRDLEYYDTSFNPVTSGLDLATDNKSWTFLTWILPNATPPTDIGVIMGKGGATSGIEVFVPPESLAAGAIASGIGTAAFNGGLAPSQWNHLAIVFDRDNDEFQTIVNGRYAGGNFNTLLEVPPNASGMAIGGRGDQERLALTGGTAFSGVLDDTMLFSRALTLPEISGLAANSYNFLENLGPASGIPIGGYISGIGIEIVSGLIGSWMHGMGQELELHAGYVSGVSGEITTHGGWIHGKAIISGQIGAWMHGAGQVSGHFGYFMHGLDIVSGFIGSYEFGACQALSEFDVTLNFSVVSFNDFDARLGVEKTREHNFDARLGVIQVTRPPICTLEMPLIGVIGSGTPDDPFSLTVQGSGIAQSNKTVDKVRFTFSDFKGAELGTLVAGEANSGLYEATRVLDTSGWYTVKIEVVDSFGYRASCARPFFLIPSGVESGVYLNDLPGINFTSNLTEGSTIQRVLFEHSLSGLVNTSGLLEYTDFSDEQESLVNSLEMPSGSAIFASGFREHDYTMPGTYTPVWAVSGSWGIVSDSISIGIDYLV